MPQVSEAACIRGLLSLTSLVSLLDLSLSRLDSEMTFFADTKNAFTLVFKCHISPCCEVLSWHGEQRKLIKLRELHFITRVSRVRSLGRNTCTCAAQEVGNIRGVACVQTVFVVNSSWTRYLLEVTDSIHPEYKTYLCLFIALCQAHVRTKICLSPAGEDWSKTRIALCKQQV